MSRPETKASSYGAEHDGPVHEGGLSGNGKRFAIVAARFNDFIVEKLIDGAKEALRRTRRIVAQILIPVIRSDY